MQIYIDPTRLSEIMRYDDPFSLLWFLLKHGGWLILIVSFAWTYYFVWREWKRRDVLWNIPNTIFAIDIPKDNEQTVKAVEEIMNTLHGMKSAPTAKENYILGYIQLWVSFEIISIEGYVQFLIRAPKKFDDMIKSIVYAHYPNAEMTEVEDYMNIIPQNANDPDSRFKGFGMHFYLGGPGYLPIKTYKEFEHSMSQTYIDPLANLLELMGKMGPGEFMGLLILAKPSDEDHVVAGGKKEIAKTMGRVTKASKDLIDKLMDKIGDASEAIYELWGDISSPEEKDQLKALTPGERGKIQNIEGKIGSYLWEARIMSLYIAPKEKFLIGRALYGIQGAFRQFAFENQFKNKKTKADYLFKIPRERKNVQAFIKQYTKRNTFETIPLTLSSAEIASIYHFPDQNVKAPLLKRTESRTVQPPTQLPFETAHESKLFIDKEIEKEKTIINDKIDNKEIIDLDLDNKYFESKFAKNEKDKIDAQNEFQEELREENSQPPTENIIKDSEEDRIKPPENLPFAD